MALDQIDSNILQSCHNVESGVQELCMARESQSRSVLSSLWSMLPKFPNILPTFGSSKGAPAPAIAPAPAPHPAPVPTEVCFIFLLQLMCAGCSSFFLVFLRIQRGHSWRLFLHR